MRFVVCWVYIGGGYLRLWATLQLRLDVPGEQWLAVFLENCVCDEGVFILCIEEQTVHVEETCSDAGETGGVSDCRRSEIYPASQEYF